MPRKGDCASGARLRLTRPQRLHEAQKVAVRVLDHDLRLPMSNVALTVPVGLKGAKDRRTRCQKPGVQRFNLCNLDLQVDPPAERRGKLAGQPGVIRKRLNHDLRAPTAPDRQSRLPAGRT